MGEPEALVEIEYDGVIPSGAAWGFSDLSDPKVHPILLTVVDKDGNRATTRFDLWERSRQHLATFELGEAAHAVAFAGAGTLASGSAEGVNLWDLETRTGVTTSLSAAVTAVAVSPDGATLASGSAGGQVQLLDLQSSRVVATLSEHAQEIRSLAFSPDGTILASGGQDGIRLWDMEARTLAATLPGGVTSVAFSPDGATLASGSRDGVRLRDVETEAEVATYRHGSGGWGPGVNSVAFSPDGALVASGGDDTTVRLWEVATGEDVAALEGHARPVGAVAFSVDGTMLASGGPDLAVSLWDPVSGERLAELRGEGRGINSLTFSPDGRTLAAGAEDGTIGLWDVSDWVRPRPGGLVRVSGDGQQGTVGEPLGDPLVVEVRDQYGNPLPGVEVAFSVVQGDGRVGGQFTVERITSDANGRAKTLLTLGPIQGVNKAEASVKGLGAVTFSAFPVGEPETPPLKGNFHTWHLPDAATARLGKGRIDGGDRAVALSPSGELLAVATHVGVWLYDAETSKEVALLPARAVSNVAFSPDGAVLASCGSYIDPTIRVWEVASGREMETIDLRVNAVAFSPDGRTLATGSDRGIELWDVDTWTQRAVASTAEGTWGILSVAFSPDGRTLAAGSYFDFSVQLWDVATVTKTATFQGHRDNVGSVAFSPDGSTVASASDDHTVRLWDVATGSNTATLDEHESWVWSVAFSPDGRILASGAADHTIKLFDLATGESTTLEGHRHWVESVAFAPDGRALFSVSVNAVRLWDVATGSSATLAMEHSGIIHSVALSPDGTRLAAASISSPEVPLWDVATGTRATLSGHAVRLNAVVFSPDGATLASGASDRTIKLWDVATGAEIATLGPAPSWVSFVALSPDGKTIASGHGNGTIEVWDVATGVNTATLRGGHSGIVGAVAFSPDGSTLATGSFNNQFRLWDLASGTQALAQGDFPERIYAVSFSPDGTALALGWDPGARVASIWQVPPEAGEATLSVEYPAWVTSGAFSPDGETVLSGSYSSDNATVVEMREVATGNLIASPRAHGGRILALAFTPDESVFASGSADGTILVWDLRRVLPHPRSLAGLSGANQEGRPHAVLARPFVIEVRDQHGDPLEGAEVTFAVTAGGGTLSVTRVATDERGRASATLTLGLAPGPNTVEVTVGDLEPVTFTAETRSIPTTLSIVGGDAQQGPSGSPLTEPLVVSLLDQAGSPLAGAAVTFAVTAGEGTLSVTRATTDAEGRATSTLTLGRTPGANSVEVNAAGLAPVTFIALGVAVPRTLARLSGDGQAAEPGAQLPEPLVVSVRDQNGSAYPGAVVTFAILGEGGILTAVSDTTDAEGQASTILTLGKEYGTYSVVAAVADLEPVAFNLAAKASPDFDGDGEVGFEDFFLFSEAFGGSDPRFDLDGSGTVDFADFFLFAEHFGQPARAKLMALARERIGLPDGPQLRQNAPNPFNSGTVISWFQLQPGPARVEVFALTGQRVAVLHQGPKKAGFHRLRWDARDDQGRPLASGVYLYRLVTTENVQTRKLTLLR